MTIFTSPYYLRDVRYSILNSFYWKDCKILFYQHDSPHLRGKFGISQRYDAMMFIWVEFNEAIVILRK